MRSPAVRAWAAARGVLPPVALARHPVGTRWTVASAWSASHPGWSSVADAVAPVPQAPQEVPDPRGEPDGARPACGDDGSRG